jgi:hypothetical protein
MRRRDEDVAGRPAQPNDPAAWGYAARSPTAGKIWRTTPPSPADTSAARPRFSVQIAPGNSSRPVEPFSFRPDKNLPGTLHHSGNRPAPPSDYIPLARRSAFCAPGNGAGNSKAHAGLKRLQRDFCRAGARQTYLSAHERWNFAIPLPLCRRTGDFHESQRRRIYAHEVGNSGLLEVAISDRRSGQVGKDRSKACPVGHAPRPAKDRSRAEARSAPTDVLIGVRTGYSRPLYAPVAGVRPA